MAYLVVFSTAPSKKSARKLADLLLNQRLAACVSILPGLESSYWWRKKKEKSKEVLLIIKTKASCYKKLEQTLKANHPYDLPEIMALSVKKGLPAYLNWLSRETR